MEKGVYPRSAAQERQARPPIAEKTHACLQGFNDILSASTSNASPANRDAIEDNLARFRLWVGSIGAYHFDNKSADYRVRDAPEVAERILELLEDVLESNRDIYAILNGLRVNAAEEAADVEPDPTDAGTGSEAEELCLIVSDAISSLLKVSGFLRKTTGRDRYAKAAASKDEPFISAFDIRHVADKFPKVNSRPWLRDSLGKANVQRRQYLRYARKHHDRMAHDPYAHDSSWTVAASQLGSRLGGPGAAPKTSMSSGPTLAPTDASTLIVDYITPSSLQQMDVNDLDDTVSQATSMVASHTDIDTGVELEVIRLSDVAKDGQPFECPHCWQVVQARRQRSWKKHVLRDIRAWVCTFPDCSAGLFEERDSWFQHELENHRRQWTCQSCPGKLFSSAKGMEEHLTAKHRLPAERLQTMLNSSSRPVAEIEVSACPLCDDWEVKMRAKAESQGLSSDSILVASLSDFRRHLGNHLEQLALFAIPPNLERSLESDSGDGSRRAASAGNAREAMRDWQEGIDDLSDTGSEIINEGDLHIPQEDVKGGIASQIEKLKLLTREASETNPELFETVLKLVPTPNGAEDAIVPFIKGLQSWEPKLQLYTLRLVDALCQHGGPAVHRQLASALSVQVLVSLVQRPETDYHVRNLALLHMEHWSKMFQNDPELGQMEHAYRILTVPKPEGTLPLPVIDNVAPEQEPRDAALPLPTQHPTARDFNFASLHRTLGELQGVMMSTEEFKASVASLHRQVLALKDSIAEADMEPHVSKSVMLALGHVSTVTTGFTQQVEDEDARINTRLVEDLGQQISFIASKIRAGAARSADITATKIPQGHANSVEQEAQQTPLRSAQDLSAKQRWTQEELLVLFKEADVDDTGTLSKSQLGKTISERIAPPDPKTLDMLWSMFGIDNEERMDLDTFRGTFGFLDAWDKLFVRFDHDNTGCLHIEKFEEALVGFGYSLSRTCVAVIFGKFATPADAPVETGRASMDFSGFIRACISLKWLTDVFKKCDVDRDGLINRADLTAIVELNVNKEYQLLFMEGMNLQKQNDGEYTSFDDFLTVCFPLLDHIQFSQESLPASAADVPLSSTDFEQSVTTSAAPRADQVQHQDRTAGKTSILKKPTEKFKDMPDFVREGVAPRIDPTQKAIPPGSRWTKIDRRLVNPEALEEAKERFEEREDSVIVLRVLTREEIQKLAQRTIEIRNARYEEGKENSDIEDDSLVMGDENAEIDYELLGLVVFGY